MVQTQAAPPVTGRLSARLRESRWLLRRLEVIAPEGGYEVLWDGRGLARESVLVNGHEAVTRMSVWWWVPRFDFVVGPHQGRVDVGVTPWFSVRYFALTIGDEVVYSEGRRWR